MKDQVTSIEQSKLPIEVHNKLIPFKGFSWVTWLVFAFTRKPMAWSMDETTRRHEGIHCAQQIELAGLFAAILLPVAISYSFAWWGWVLTVLGILFAGWICYGISWLIEVIIPPYPGAYYYTCFETEAYNHEDDPDYLRRRIPFWGWISCIPNRKVKHKR